MPLLTGVSAVGVRIVYATMTGSPRLTADREPARDAVMVDGALVEVHRHGAGARKADALTMPDESRAAEAI